MIKALQGLFKYEIIIHMETVRKIFLCAGIIFALYGLTVLSLIGPGRLFNYFYLVSGIILIVISKLMEGMSDPLKKITVLFIFIAVIIFALTEIRIISFAMKEPEKNADYLIVLGSQMKDNGPSVDYKARLDSAYEYLSENPKTKVITTGAQGYKEPVSEAQGGADYLRLRGIDPERIIIEDQSYDTLENLGNAQKLIIKDGKDPADIKVVIVSAVYHLYRASFIAGKIDYGNVSCKGGCGLFVLLPHYYTREFFATVKEYLVLR